MNQSAHEMLALARVLGGTPFVDFLVTMQSQAMADHVFPEIRRLKLSPEQARVCDRAFVIGLYEAWSALAGPGAPRHPAESRLT